jgi:ATP-dependent RNA helicase DeaD
MLRVIERATRSPVEQMQLPSIEDVNERRVAKFNEKLAAAIATNAGQAFLPLIESYERDNNVPAAEIAAALASIAQGATPLLLEPQSRSDRPRDAWSPGASESSDRGPRRERAPRPDRAARDEKYAKRERDLQSREQEGEGSSQPERPAWSSSQDAGDSGAQERAPRSSWNEGAAAGARSSRNEGGDASARRERTPRSDFAPREAGASRSDRGPREERSSRGSEWAPREDRASRPRKAQPDREVESTGGSERNVWGEETASSVHIADFWKGTGTQEAPVVDQGPRPPNRRERRAMERAERERLAAGGEVAATGEVAAAGEGAATGGVAATSEVAAESISHNDGDANREPREEAQTRERVESGGVDASERPRKHTESRDSNESERPRKREFGASSEGERPRKPATTREFSQGDRSRERAPARDFGDEKRPRRGDEDVETYRIEVGHDHGVKPGNIVGAIANEVGLDGRHIGRVVIQDDHSFVDLPAGMPKEVFLQLQKVRVAGQPLQLSRALKTHVEKLRRDRPAGPKFRKPGEFKGMTSKPRGPRDSKPRR